MKELVLSLDDRHLVIQGPPGSGKTWTSGRLIAHLLANGKTVGVASTSHKAIHNLLDAVVEAAGELGIAFDGRKKASAGNPESYYRQEPIADVGARRRDPRRRPRGRHGVALRPREPAGRLPVHRRGRPGVARRRARDGDGGAESRARRRSAAARPGDPGDAPRRERRLGATAPARRRGDGAARPRPLPRAYVPPAPRRVRLHLGGVLRRPARSRPRWRADGRRRSAQAFGTSPSSTTDAGRSRPRRSRPCAASSKSYAPPA